MVKFLLLICGNEYLTDLRREARFLENEIDAKLVSFSKIGANAQFNVPTPEKYVKRFYYVILRVLV